MVFGSQTPHLVITRAKVTANNDPKHMGRVQVTFPFFSGDAKQTPTSWARICFPYASQQNGMWFIPDVGDEVLVAFESTNVGNPIILGSFYGDKNSPPESGMSGDFNSDGKNSLKFIKTRAGNVFSLDDSPGKESIKMKDAAGATVKVENGKVAIGNNVGELFALLEDLLNTLQNSAPTLVSTAVGPGIMNPSLLAKISEVKMKLGQIKGDL